MRRAWWQMPSLRWLAPALATGLAVAVWVAVGDRQPNVTPVAVPTSAPAQSPTATLEKQGDTGDTGPARTRREGGCGARAQGAERAEGQRRGARGRQGEGERAAEVRARSGSSRCREAEGRGARQEGPHASSGAAACCSATRGRIARRQRLRPRRALWPAPDGAALREGQVRPDSAETNGSVRRPGGVRAPQKRWQCRSPTSLHRTRARAGESAALRCNARPTTVTRGRLRTQARPFGSRRAPRPTPTSAGSSATQGTVLVSVDGRSWQRLKSPDPALLVSVTCHERRCRHGDDERRPNVCH